MKKSAVLFALLTLSLTAFTQDSGLWLLTARVTESRTMNRDTLISTEAGNHKWETEKRATTRTVAHGEITAVIENQAEIPDKEFAFDSDSGEPVNITISGQGSHSASSKYLETIDGKMVNASIRDINVSGSSFPGASIMFYYSVDSKNVSISTGINAKGSDKGRRFDEEWKDFGDDIDHYYISYAGGCDVSSNNNCKITKTGSGYHATWKSSENKQLHSVDGTAFITSETTLEVTISPYKEPDKPEVSLYGCSDLGTEEQKDVMASGKPEGGKFRFWVEPGSLLNVEADGESSAILTGATPGKGTLYVEYTTPTGKTNTASQPASFVKIENYNGGQKIPQIALYNIEGKKTNGLLTVPVTMEPAGSSDLLRFEVASPDILSATGVAENVLLQGIRTGTTSVQAKTQCGKPVGPSVDAEVVYCDDETKAKLAEEARIASEIIKEQLKQLEDIINSEEYKKASGRILESSANLALKTSGLIFGMAAGVPGVDQAVKATGDVFGAGSAVLDLIRSGNLSEAGMNTIKLGVELFGEAVMGVISGAEETYQAAKDFGEDLGVVEGATYKISNAQQWIEHWSRYIDDLIRRQKLCESGTGQDGGQGETSQEPVQKPAVPGSGTANEPTDGAGATEPGEQPSAEDPASGEAAGEKTPGEGEPGEEPGGEKVPGEGGEISPPPPTTATGQAGLPYAPGECGCNSTKTQKPGTEVIATLQAEMQNLNKCVGDFQNGPLNGYVKTLGEWKAVTDGLEIALGKDQKSAESAMLEAIPRMETLLQQTQSFDIAGQEFIKDFEKCPVSSSSWMDVLKTALTVTVDSIKTKY